MSGIIQARTAENINGTIILRGGDTGSVDVSGKLDVSGLGTGETGGTLHVFGEKINLFDRAFLNASGDEGGGTILVGGEYQGLGDYPTASEVFVDRGASIFNDAITSGHGGKSIFWANRRMRFFGSVYARGGREWGDGGFIEVSGKEELFFDGWADTSAPNGLMGTLLLDPEDIIIKNGSGTASGAITFTTFEQTLEALSGNTNIELLADNSITLENLSDNLLNLNISGSLTMTAINGAITFLDTNDKIKSTRNINLNAGGNLTLGSIESTEGNITLTGNNLFLGGTLSSVLGTTTLTSSQGITLQTSLSSEGDTVLNAGTTITLANGISITSGGTLALNSTSGTNAQGAVTLSSANGLTLSDDFTSAGTATFNADSDDDGTGTFTVASGKNIVTGGNTLSVTGADIALSGNLNSGAGTTTLLSSNGGTIGMGAGAETFQLSNSELGNITAGNLFVGDSTTGNITVDGVTAANSNNIAGTTTLNATGSGKSVTFSGTASTFNGLTVNAQNGVAINTGVTTDAGGLTLSGGTGSITGSGTTNLNSSQGITLNSNFSSTGNASLTAGTTITLANGISVSSGGTLTLASTTGTNAQGAVTVSSANGLTLSDDFTSAGTATFNADSDGNGTGTFTVASGKTVATAATRCRVQTLRSLETSTAVRARPRYLRRTAARSGWGQERRHFSSVTVNSETSLLGIWLSVTVLTAIFWWMALRWATTSQGPRL